MMDIAQNQDQYEIFKRTLDPLDLNSFGKTFAYE